MKIEAQIHWSMLKRNENHEISDGCKNNCMAQNLCKVNNQQKVLNKFRIEYFVKEDKFYTGRCDAFSENR